MKKIKYLITVMILVLMSSVSVLADGAGNYEIDDVGLKVVVPDGYNLAVYTRDSKIEEGDNFVPAPNTFYTYMEENNEYLRAYHPNNDFVIHVYSMTTQLPDFDNIEADEVVRLVEGGFDGYLDGQELVNCSVAKPVKLQYAAVDFREELNDGRFLERFMYATAINGRMYCYEVQMESGKYVSDYERGIVKEFATGSYYYDATEAETELVIIDANTEAQETDSTAASDMIAQVVSIAKYLIVVVLAIALIIVIHGVLSNNKRERVMNKEVPYSVRRTPQYEDRIKRVMSSIPETTPVEPEPKAVEPEDELGLEDEEI